MDEGRSPSPDIRAHVDACEVCSGFERGAWRLRDLTRFEIAPEVPDLTSQIMTTVRREPATWRRRPAPLRPVPRPVARRQGWIPQAAVVALLVGFAVGTILSWGGVVPRSKGLSPALAEEIPRRLLGAAQDLRGYRATFDIVERNWTGKVPERTFRADVAFRAPEGFRVRVRDATRYPKGDWPRNDLELVTDGRSWRATGPEACPRGALPECGEVIPVTRAVTGRAPFEASTAMPTDVIVPMTVLAASGRVQVIGEGPAAGRDAVAVRMDAGDASPLFRYLHFLGSWRPFYPQDRVVVWLDRATWFPVRYEVLPAPGEERAAWAAQNGLPAEPPGRAVFEAEVRSLSTAVPPTSAFRVSPGPDPVDQGFRAGPTGRGFQPTWLDALRPWRAGSFVRTAARPFTQSVTAYARGLSWLTVTRVARWTQDRAFGVGPFAEPVPLPSGGVGLYEPASDTEPRRIAFHTGAGELLLATNLPRATLERIAGSLPVRVLDVPGSWRIHRWAGGVVEDGLSPDDAVGRAGFDVRLPDDLPDAYRATSARLIRTPGERTITIIYRRPAAELGGAGLILTQAQGQTVAPPTEAGVVAIAVGDAIGRWTPTQHLLEWMDDGVYRAVSSSTLDLGTLVRVARSLRPPGPDRAAEDES
jgi:hypothetical protein